MSALVEALRSKYKGDHRAALRALGVDEDLLDDPGSRQRKRDKAMRRHIDEMLSLLDTLGADSDPSMRAEEATSERGGRFDPRGSGGGGEIVGGPEREGKDRRHARGRDTDPPIVHPASEQNRGRGPGTAEDEELTEEEERSLQASAADWKKKGATDEEIERNLDFARDALRRHRGRAGDVLPKRVDVQDGKDRMPLRGGKFNRPRFTHDEFEVENPNEGKFLVDHGLDAMDGSRWEIKIHELLKRFGPEAGCCPDRNRFATDSKPLTKEQTAELHKLIPGLALIGDVYSGDGPGLRDYKGRYEV